MRRPLLTFFIASMFAGLMPLAGAQQSKADTVIRYRQGLMNVMGWNIDQLGAMVRHTGALDAKEFAMRAERLAALGPQIAEGFPKGTGSADKVAVNDAAPAIWSDAAGFQAKIDEYITETKKLLDAAKTNDDAQMRAQFRKVSDSCRGCHDMFKAD
jgi:cytochrome c556